MRIVAVALIRLLRRLQVLRLRAGAAVILVDAVVGGRGAGAVLLVAAVRELVAVREEALSAPPLAVVRSASRAIRGGRRAAGAAVRLQPLAMVVRVAIVGAVGGMRTVHARIRRTRRGGGRRGVIGGVLRALLVPEVLAVSVVGAVTGASVVRGRGAAVVVVGAGRCAVIVGRMRLRSAVRRQFRRPAHLLARLVVGAVVRQAGGTVRRRSRLLVVPAGGAAVRGRR